MVLCHSVTLHRLTETLFSKIKEQVRLFPEFLVRGLDGNIIPLFFVVAISNATGYSVYLFTVTLTLNTTTRYRWRGGTVKHPASYASKETTSLHDQESAEGPCG